MDMVFHMKSGKTFRTPVVENEVSVDPITGVQTFTGDFGEFASAFFKLKWMYIPDMGVVVPDHVEAITVE